MYKAITVNDEPPYDNNGSGIPIIGINPIFIEILYSWLKINTPIKPLVISLVVLFFALKKILIKYKSIIK